MAAIARTDKCFYLRRDSAALDSPVYRYLVTHTPSGPVAAASDLLPFPSRFSFHCLDVVSFFGGLEAVLGKPLSDEDQKFQGLITQHLLTFAKTGELTSSLNSLTLGGGGATRGRHRFVVCLVFDWSWLPLPLPPSDR